MKVWRIVVVLVVVLGLFQMLVSFRQQDKTPDLVVRTALCKQIDSLRSFLNDSLALLVEGNASETYVQQAFLKTRLYYKKIEWAAEYFTYATAKLINGAAKPEMEIASQKITTPNGLQVVETLLFPHYSKSNKEELQEKIGLLVENVSILKSYFSHIDIASWQILDAAKLEVFRVESLGIVGFDNPLTLHAMQESAAALESVGDVVQSYLGEDDSLRNVFSGAVNYLQNNSDFVSFDRAFFIQHYANPLSRSIEKIRRNYSSNELKYNRLLRQDAPTLFDSGAFNAMAYAPVLEQKNQLEKIILGKQLFNDPVFSGTQTRSCASCHIEAQAFANNLIKEKDISGHGFIDRNTPTLINTALQPQQFYDQRAENIEDQIVDVIHNPKEMNGSIVKALPLIQTNPNYKKLFQKAFPEKGAMTASDIVESLSAYIRSLARLNSRFDNYMRGDYNALTMSEVNGFNLFMGKAQCATCHYMPLFSGVFPPKYISQDVEVLGVPASSTSKLLDKDRGLFTILSRQGIYDSLLMLQFDHGFKTVSVRNVSKTAPYMHNGAFATLEEVMDLYNSGGGIGNGINVPNQTLSSDKLNLTPKEIKDIVAFMKSLESN